MVEFWARVTKKWKGFNNETESWLEDLCHFLRVQEMVISFSECQMFMFRDTNPDPFRPFLHRGDEFSVTDIDPSSHQDPQQPKLDLEVQLHTELPKATSKAPSPAPCITQSGPIRDSTHNRGIPCRGLTVL